MAPVVAAYQAMRGASFLVAVTFAAEIGDVRRFDTPRQLMSFLGLVAGGKLDRRYGETQGFDACWQSTRETSFG
jgi:transposase